MSEPDFYSKDKKEYYKRKSGGSNRKKEYSKLIRVNNMQFFDKTLCYITSTAYLCTVFFMVLDLRLTKIGCLG